MANHRLVGVSAVGVALVGVAESSLSSREVGGSRTEGGGKRYDRASSMSSPAHRRVSSVSLLDSGGMQL